MGSQFSDTLQDMPNAWFGMRQATHKDLANRLYQSAEVAGSKRFSKPKLSQTGFTIEHYAGPVTYKTESFLAKNRDFVVAEHQGLLQASGEGFVQLLFPAEPEANGNAVSLCRVFPARYSTPAMGPIAGAQGSMDDATTDGVTFVELRVSVEAGAKGNITSCCLTCLQCIPSLFHMRTSSLAFCQSAKISNPAHPALCMRTHLGLPGRPAPPQSRHL